VKAEDLYRVSHKVAVVTGGAHGLGFAMARALSDNGAKVVLFDVDRDGLDAAVKDLTARGGRVRSEIVDLTDRAAIDAAFARVVATEGGLDAVFANAGITAGPGFLSVFGGRDEAGAI
jgi:NAD(P)-dependent dehydrogenase (short-subunit alcohol dehydrogenase family)